MGGVFPRYFPSQDFGFAEVNISLTSLDPSFVTVRLHSPGTDKCGFEAGHMLSAAHLGIRRGAVLECAFTWHPHVPATFGAAAFVIETVAARPDLFVVHSFLDVPDVLDALDG